MALLLLVWYASLGGSFLVSVKPINRMRTSEVRMGGGRSLEEKKFSKRQLFHQLRNKFIEAAKQPGFLDDESTAPKELEVFVKATKDGKQISDCPFAQFVQLVLLKKGISYDLKLTTPATKPAWLLEKHDGQMPALVHKGHVVTDSLKIAEYIDKTFPHDSLTRQGAFSYQEILEKTNNFFPTLSAFVKNKDDAKDAALMLKFEEQLDMLDEMLRTTPGQYIGGIEMTLADLYLLPQLFHATVAVDHFKDCEVLFMEGDYKRPALESYMSRMFELREFNDKRVYVSADKIVHGWKLIRGDIKPSY
jgi:glutathione S-transferase